MTQKRKLAAIMFTDIVGYTALMSKDEEKALELLQRNRALLKPIIGQFRGQWLKEIGDGTLSSFESAVDAVQCALEVQHIFRSDPDLSLRIGIHVGDVLFEGGDVFGDGVNVASRLEPLAEPGGICVSERVYEDIRNHQGVEAASLGEKTLKGVDHRVEVYSLTEIRAPQAGVKGEAPQFAGPRRLAPFAAIITAVALLAIFLSRGWLDGDSVRGPGPAIDDKSVAVLPFTNLSASQEDEYFSDGITDNILTQLFKIGDLKVIARTSVMQYKGTTKRMRDIAAELGVKTLLEGSVQRSTDRVIITAQLIDAESELHLWAETYDRQIADIFDIQMEVALAIAQALKATLTPEVEARLAIQPTENMAAYEAYLRGNRRWDSGWGRRELGYSIASFEESTRLDPRFAEAWAQLSVAHLFYRWLGYDTSDDRLAQAEQALEQANALAPDRVIVRNARGRYHYHGHRNYARALQEFYPALQLEPNNPAIIANIGFIERRLGNFDRALEQFLRAFELDPRSASRASEIMLTYGALEDYDNAVRYARQSVSLNPSSANNISRMARTLFEQTGDAAEALTVLKRADRHVPEVDLLFPKGRYQIEAGREPDAITSLTRHLERLPPNDPRQQDAHGLLGNAHHYAGLTDRAMAHWEQARSLAQAEVDRIGTDMMNSSPTMWLATIEVRLGFHDQAQRHADESVAALPVSHDLWSGQQRLIDQAWVYFTSGETDRAFGILEPVMAEPRYPGKKRLLVWRRWQALKADPRYPALAAKYGLPE